LIDAEFVENVIDFCEFAEAAQRRQPRGLFDVFDQTFESLDFLRRLFSFRAEAARFGGEFGHGLGEPPGFVAHAQDLLQGAIVGPQAPHHEAEAFAALQRVGNGFDALTQDQVPQGFAGDTRSLQHGYATSEQGTEGLEVAREFEMIADASEKRQAQREFIPAPGATGAAAQRSTARR